MIISRDINRVKYIYVSRISYCPYYRSTVKLDNNNRIVFINNCLPEDATIWYSLRTITFLNTIRRESYVYLLEIPYCLLVIILYLIPIMTSLSLTSNDNWILTVVSCLSLRCLILHSIAATYLIDVAASCYYYYLIRRFIEIPRYELSQDIIQTLYIMLRQVISVYIQSLESPLFMLIMLESLFHVFTKLASVKRNYTFSLYSIAKLMIYISENNFLYIEIFVKDYRYFPN